MCAEYVGQLIDVESSFLSAFQDGADNSDE